MDYFRSRRPSVVICGTADADLVQVVRQAAQASGIPMASFQHGGAYGYIEDGAMTRGFGMVASPAKYGASGVMSFLVNQLGLVYEKDLGPETEKLAMSMESFDPDDSWALVPANALVLPDD